jgi:hypothetical protein
MAQVRFPIVLAFVALVAGCSEWHGLEADAAVESDAYRIHSILVADGGARGCDVGLVCDDAWTAPDVSVVEIDASMRVSCGAQDAHETICPTTLCDGLDQWAWDGERCVAIDCGACVGADCLGLPHSPDACAASHASCPASLCRASGGGWLFWAAACGDYHCGYAPPADCLVGMPVCDCGDGRSFEATRGGCFDDPSCPPVDPLPPETLCTSTGGTWSRGICCPTRCGQPCAAACANDACTCGDLQVFDPIRGCIDDASCHVRASGEACSAQTRCADGLICCERCGGASCDPVMHCQAPVCSTDPNIDRCGNDRLAP